MQEFHASIKNENGFAMIITLMVLIFLTIAILAAFNSMILDIRISSNDRLATEAEFSSHSCASLKARELRAGKANAITMNGQAAGLSDPSAVTAGLEVKCQTDQPQLAFYSGALPGFQTGIPKGYKLFQMRFNSTGKAGGNSQETMQYLTQNLQQGE